MARSFEEALELPFGYFDDPNNHCPSSYEVRVHSPMILQEPSTALLDWPKRHNLTKDELTILEAYRLADARLRRVMLVSAQEVIESFARRNEISTSP